MGRQLAAVPKLPFALLIGAILTAGLVALLLLHTMAAQDAFRLHDLQRQAGDLRDAEQQLAADNQRLQAPETLAARARALGMVPTDGVAFVRLRSGRVVGVAHATAPAPAPQPSSAPDAKKSKVTSDAAAQPSGTRKHHGRAGTPSPGASPG